MVAGGHMATFAGGYDIAGIGNVRLYGARGSGKGAQAIHENRLGLA